MNIITGEKIQNLCDYYIGSIGDFNFNLIFESKNGDDAIKILENNNIDILLSYADRLGMQ